LIDAIQLADVQLIGYVFNAICNLSGSRIARPVHFVASYARILSRGLGLYEKMFPGRIALIGIQQPWRASVSSAFICRVRAHPSPLQ
jgi:hypothetical protein